MSPLRPRVGVRVAAALLLALAGGLLAAMRSGRMTARPVALGAVVILAALVTTAALLLAARRLVRGPPTTALAGEALTWAGVLLALGAGLLGWSRSVTGAFLAFEREPLRLSRPADLVDLQAGPLADAKLLDLTVALAKLELRAAGPAAFFPVSHLRVLDAAGEEAGVDVARGAPGHHGALVFHQGAFGFAPRIYVTHGADVLLDANVPLRTSRAGPDGLQFLGEFELAREKLLFRASVDLGPLDPDMKGHPLLELSAERAGAPIGAGKLRPGEYATLDGGYRVLFAGLKRWSEIDFVRHRNPLAVRWGLVLALAGAVGWAIGAWRTR